MSAVYFGHTEVELWTAADHITDGASSAEGSVCLCYPCSNAPTAVLVRVRLQLDELVNGCSIIVLARSYVGCVEGDV